MYWRRLMIVAVVDWYKRYKYQNGIQNSMRIFKLQYKVSLEFLEDKIWSKLLWRNNNDPLQNVTISFKYHKFDKNDYYLYITDRGFGTNHL